MTASRHSTRRDCRLWLCVFNACCAGSWRLVSCALLRAVRTETPTEALRPSLCCQNTSLLLAEGSVRALSMSPFSDPFSSFSGTSHVFHFSLLSPPTPSLTWLLLLFFISVSQKLCFISSRNLQQISPNDVESRQRLFALLRQLHQLQLQQIGYLLIYFLRVGYLNSDFGTLIFD